MRPCYTPCKDLVSVALIRSVPLPRLWEPDCACSAPHYFQICIGFTVREVPYGGVVAQRPARSARGYYETIADNRRTGFRRVCAAFRQGFSLHGACSTRTRGGYIHPAYAGRCAVQRSSIRSRHTYAFTNPPLHAHAPSG